MTLPVFSFFFFQAEDGIRYLTVTGVQTCALPIWSAFPSFPLTQTSGRLFHLTLRSSGGRSSPILAHTARDCPNARSRGSRVRSSRREIGRASCRERV